MMRLLKSIVVQRGVLVRDFVRGCLGSTDAAPVECPDNFIMWEEVSYSPKPSVTTFVCLQNHRKCW